MDIVNYARNPLSYLQPLIHSCLEVFWTPVFRVLYANDEITQLSVLAYAAPSFASLPGVVSAQIERADRKEARSADI
jgi:hypothetical protein